MAPDALLSGNDREEALSWAYVRAVAAFAGYTLSAPDYDRDGIDLRIHAGGELSPSVGLQLKATTRLGPPQPARRQHHYLRGLAVLAGAGYGCRRTRFRPLCHRS